MIWWGGTTCLPVKGSAASPVLKEPEAPFKRGGVVEDAHVTNLHITIERFGSGAMAERV